MSKFSRSQQVFYVQKSPFSSSEKIKARVWAFINMTLFRCTPWFFRGGRRFLLRLFGAKIGAAASIHQAATINYPWRLTMGSFASIGEGAYVDCLDVVDIEDYAIVGQFSTILTGSHDLSDRSFRLITSPVKIKYGSWICTRAVVLPGVTVGERSVIGACSVVSRDIPNDVVAVGNPCRRIKDRVFHE